MGVSEVKLFTNPTYKNTKSYLEEKKKNRYYQLCILKDMHRNFNNTGGQSLPFYIPGLWFNAKLVKQLVGKDLPYICVDGHLIPMYPSTDTALKERGH